MKKNQSFLKEHSVRKSEKQKTSFIQHLCSIAANGGYVSEIEQKKSGTRNVLVGSFSDAEIVFTAHYDTPSRSLIPTFVTPKTPILTTLSQILVALIVLVPTFATFFGTVFALMANGFLPTAAAIISIFPAIAVFVILILTCVSGPARKNNENSNTSGVLTLLEIMDNMPKELRSKVAFLFLDNQENGYLGAAYFASRHKDDINKKLIVNFDSVGVGGDALIAVNKDAINLFNIISESFLSVDGITVTVMHGGGRIPSDHNKFKNAIGVSTFKKSRSGILYLDKSIVDGDIECRVENIKYMAGAAIKFTENMVLKSSENS